MLVPLCLPDNSPSSDLDIPTRCHQKQFYASEQILLSEQIPMQKIRENTSVAAAQNEADCQDPEIGLQQG